jgi:hypothetical protein
MWRVCPDNPLMNASRHVVELVGEELEQAELEELLAVFTAPPELLEELLELPPELPVLVEALMAMVAELGEPKSALPAT